MSSAIKLVTGALVTLALPALAHPGHGLATASHWHASDAAGYAVLALAVGLLCWTLRK